MFMNNQFYFVFKALSFILLNRTAVPAGFVSSCDAALAEKNEEDDEGDYPEMKGTIALPWGV